MALGCSERGALIDALRLRFAELCNALLLAMLASEESSAAACEAAAAAVAECLQRRASEAAASSHVHQLLVQEEELRQQLAAARAREEEFKQEHQEQLQESDRRYQVRQPERIVLRMSFVCFQPACWRCPIENKGGLCPVLVRVAMIAKARDAQVWQEQQDMLQIADKSRMLMAQTAAMCTTVLKSERPGCLKCIGIRLGDRNTRSCYKGIS